MNPLLEKTYFDVVSVKDNPIPEHFTSIPVIFKSGVVAEMFTFDVREDHCYLKEKQGILLSKDELIELLDAFGKFTHGKKYISEAKDFITNHLK